MNDYQTAKQTSFKLIAKEAKNYPNEVSLIPTFATGITRLETISTKIDVISTQQAKDITGVTSDKNTVMDEVIDYLVDVSGAVHSYAISTGDQTLQAKVNYKESAISKMSQPDLTKASAIVIEEAEKIAPEVLANEGITATELAEFKTAYNEFKEITSDPRSAIIDRSGYTQQIADLFSEASDLKKNTLDRLASQFRRKAPEFYLKYKAAATVIYKRNSKTPITAEVN
jgi:hypothetical protein